MRHRPCPPRFLAAILMFSTLALSSVSWAQNNPEVKKSIKKVDRQILSYSPEKARKQLEPVKGEDDPRIDAAMGQILMLEKDYDGAAAKLEAASKSSKDPMILIALGDAYAYAKNKGKANSTYQKAIDRSKATLEKKSNNKSAQLALGTAQQRLKQYDDAVASLTKAQGMDSSNPRVPFELGMTQLLKGDNQAAFDQLSRAIDLYSGYAYAYYYRALAADKIGKKDITVNDLDRFLALAPDAPDAPKAERILQAARG